MIALRRLPVKPMRTVLYSTTTTAAVCTTTTTKRLISVETCSVIGSVIDGLIPVWEFTIPVCAGASGGMSICYALTEEKDTNIVSMFCAASYGMVRGLGLGVIGGFLAPICLPVAVPVAALIHVTKSKTPAKPK